MRRKKSVSLLLSLAMVCSLVTPFPAKALEQTTPVQAEVKAGEDISNRVVTGKMAGSVTNWNYAGTGTTADPYQILIKKMPGDPPNVAPNKFWGDPLQSFNVVFEQRQDDIRTGNLLYSYQFNTDESVEGTLNGRDTVGNRFRFTPYNESRSNADGTLDIGFSWKGTFSTFWKDWTFRADVKTLSKDAFQPGDKVKVTYYGDYNKGFDTQSGWDTTYEIDFDITDETVAWTTDTTLDGNGYLVLSGSDMLMYGGNYKVEKIADEPEPVAPAAPVLTATAGDTKVFLTWESVEGATGYVLYQDGVKVDAAELGADAVTYTVTGLTNGQAYKFGLTAKNEAGESEMSSLAVVTPKGSGSEGGNTPVEVPAAPVLMAKPGDSEAVLTWAPVDGATGYVLYQYGDKVNAAELSADTVTYTVTGLTNGQTYKFGLTAKNEAGESKMSNLAVVIPEGGDTPVTPPVEVPAAPANANAVGRHHMVELTWDAASGAKSYTIMQDGRTIKSGLKGTSYDVTRLNNGTVYSFTILAVNEAGSTASAIVKSVPNSAGPENSRPGGEGNGSGGGSNIPLAVQKTNISESPVSSKLDEIWLQFTHNVALKPTNLDYVSIRKDGADRELSISGYVVDTSVDFNHRQFLFFKLNDELEPGTDYVVTIAPGVTAKNGMVTKETQVLTFTTDGQKVGEDVVKTETLPDGTVVETTTHPDGSITVSETRKDGTTSTTNVDQDGKITAKVKLSAAFVADAARKGKPAVLPMPALKVPAQAERAPLIEIDAGREQTAVTIPVNNVPAGAVAYLVKPNGTRELVRKSALDENGVTLMVSGKVSIMLVDNARVFGDTVSHWGANAISFVSAHELFQGTSATQFMPNAPMTRAMLATVLWRLEDEAAATTASSFDDVAAGQWYSNAVNWAAQNKIVNGYGGSFAPNDSITRQQLAAMMYRYADAMGMDTNATSTMDRFNDTSLIADWAKDAMGWAVSVGLMAGKDNNQLDPAGTATRAEVAIICQRMISLMVK